MGEYGHKQSLFPKEIVLIIIAAVVLAGTTMIFGPYILSAMNNGASTVANPNPVDPVWVPKAGDTGQLPAVVNKTTTAVATETQSGDQVKISPVTGTATQTPWQEKIDSWYAIGETVYFKFPKYEMKVGMAVSRDGSFKAIPYNRGVLDKEKKYLTVNIKFKIKDENKIYQTGEISSLGFGLMAGNWNKAIDKSVPTDKILWQPEFQIKDIPTTSPEEVIVK